MTLILRPTWWTCWSAGCVIRWTGTLRINSFTPTEEWGMPLKLLNRASKKLGVRLTLWYSTFFILSSVILFIVSYVFLSTYIQGNRDGVELKLEEYLSLGQEGGIAAIQEAVGAGRDASPNTHVFVRILDSEHKIV